MEKTKKEAWAGKLGKCASFNEISVKGKFLKDPVRSFSFLLMKAPSLYIENGIKAKMRTFWGGEMVGVFPDGVSSLIYLNGFFEEGLTRMVMEFLEEGQTFVDIGSHCGYFSVLASDIVGSTGHVHSFEPTPLIFGILSENAKLHPNITPNNMALFSEPGELEFKDFGLRYSAFNSLRDPKINLEREPPSKRIKVRTTTLDEYVEKNKIKPDFIKIDAEGAEMEILKGMKKTIATFHPMLVLEVSADEDSASRKNVEYLMGLGYAPYCYEDGKITPHKVKEKYVYDNILFIHQEKDGLARI